MQVLEVTVLDSCIDNNLMVVLSASDAQTSYNYIVQSSAAIDVTLPTVDNNFAINYFVESDPTTWSRCG